MKFWNHVLLALAANAIAFYFILQLRIASGYTLVFLLEAIVITVVFAGLPDIDSIKSHASKIFRLALGIIAVWGLYEFIALQNTVGLAKAAGALLAFVGHFLYAKSGRMHRQFPHSFAFGTLACIAVLIATGSKLLSLAAAISFLSHLLADGIITQKIFRKIRV